MTLLHPSSEVGLLISSLVASAGLALITFLITKNQHARTWLTESHRALDRELLFVRAGISASAFRAVQAFCLVFGLATMLIDARVGALSVLLSLLPPTLLKNTRSRRVGHIEKQIEGWLMNLSRCLEAAPSLGEAIEASVMMCDSPMRDELKVVDNEIRLGRPIDHALAEWGARVKSRTLTMALSTLQVGRETGGSLGEVLKSAADSLREMERLEGAIRTKTAEGKAQAWVISIVPFPLYFAVKMGDPDYFVPLETTATGHVLLAIAVGLWVAATFSARKILAVQI